MGTVLSTTLLAMQGLLLSRMPIVPARCRGEGLATMPRQAQHSADDCHRPPLAVCPAEASEPTVRRSRLHSGVCGRQAPADAQKRLLRAQWLIVCSACRKNMKKAGLTCARGTGVAGFASKIWARHPAGGCDCQIGGMMRRAACRLCPQRGAALTPPAALSRRRRGAQRGCPLAQP